MVTPYIKEEILISPTLIDQVIMRVAWEEPFGPILPFIRVSRHKEAIEIANPSLYGLQAASIFTKQIEVAISIAEKLEVGTLHFNGRTERAPDHFPILGIKNSGLGSQVYSIHDKRKSFFP